MKRIEIKNTCLSLYSQILYMSSILSLDSMHLCLLLLLGIAVGVQTNLCNSWYTRPRLPRVVRGCLGVSPSQRTPCESCEFRKSENPRWIRSSSQITIFYLTWKTLKRGGFPLYTTALMGSPQLIAPDQSSQPFHQRQLDLNGGPLIVIRNKTRECKLTDSWGANTWMSQIIL